MSLSQLVLDAIDRLKQYNLGIYNAVSNKFGLSGVGGMANNWSRHSKDIATVCETVGTLADAAIANSGSAAGSATAAAGSAATAHNSELAAAGSATAAASSASAAGTSAAGATGSATTAATKAGEAAASAMAAAGSATIADQFAAAAGGALPAVRGSWSASTTDTDVGNGKVWANGATLTAATMVYVDNLDAAGASVTTVVDRWGASTNAVKGTLRIAHRTDLTKWVEYQIMGAVVDGGGYRKIPVTGGAGPGGFSANDVVSIGFTRAGDAGTTPSSFAAGSATAPGWMVTGDSDTGLAQVGGANSVSLIAGGSEALRAVLMASAVNALSVSGAVSGDHPYLIPIGADTNIGINLKTKGAGQLLIRGGDHALQVAVVPVVGATRNLTMSGSAGGNPQISTSGGALNLTSATGQVLINGAAISGAVSFPTAAKSAAYTVTAADAGKLIVATGTWTLSLPAVGTVGVGFTIAIKNIGIGLITVDPSGTELVDLALTGLLASRQSVILVCDGTGWSSIGGLGFSTAQQWSATTVSSGITLSESNLRAALSGNTSNYQTVRGANALPDGASYWEVSCLSFPGMVQDSGLLGIVDANFTDFVNRPLSPGAYQTDGSLRKSSGTAAFGAPWGGGDTMMFAFRKPAGGSGSLWIGKNGIWQGSGDPVAGTNAAITAISQQVFPMASANLAPVYRARFSPLEFVYTLPSGFSPLA